MVKINFEDYKPVKFKTGRVSVTSGDEVNRETLLTTKTIRRHPDVEPQTFVHIRTRDVWLQRATMGQWSRGDDFSVGVLPDIGREVVDLEKRVRRNLPLHDTNDNGSPRQREDPMDEMEDVATRGPPSPVRFNKLPRGSGSFQGQVCHILMDEYPEEARTGSARKKRAIYVYIEGNKKVWIDLNDLQWLLQYAWIQQQLKGVVAVASDGEGPDGPNRSDI